MKWYRLVMIRTQITLTEDQHRRLARVARARGVSMAAVIRQAVDEVVPDESAERQRRWDRALSVIGSHRSGLPDIAEKHDDYLPDTW